jgi:putative SOS response-associated peptidase YedK
MCNLNSLTKGQQAIRDLAGAMRDVTGNLPLFPGIFRDYAAPIVRNAPDGVRELSTARWGMPSTVFALKGRNSDPGVTNVRNISSPHWRRWFGVESRCVVIPRKWRRARKRPGYGGARKPAHDEAL